MPRQFQFRTVDGSESVQIAVRGRQVLARPMLNFGPDFTLPEREALGLRGLPPRRSTRWPSRCTGPTSSSGAALTPWPSTSSSTSCRTSTRSSSTAWSPSTSTRCSRSSTPPRWARRFRSSARPSTGPAPSISIDDEDGIDQALAAHGQRAEDVDLVVVTDSEGILGIGDQGVGGIRIAVGKLAVYTTAAGIHPLRGIPVVLDVGTDNLELLNDPGYLGARRVRGERYDAFVARFVDAVRRHYPNALLHWEDLGADNAHRILGTYRDELCTLDDDIQGTAAVVGAAVLAAVRAKGERLSDQRIVVHGAGTAGVGIADLLRDIMVEEGSDPQEAERRFWGLGSRGLLHTEGPMRDFQRRYARPHEELVDWPGAATGRHDLAEVVRQVRPTVLIGTSAQPGAFTESIVRELAAGCERPVILPLSNPASRAEAVTADLLEWTEGRALIATGSPFDPVEVDGVTHEIAQANNALVFPGLGLGAVAVRARRVTDRMIFAAAQAVAERTEVSRPGASILPSMRQLRAVSAAVAIKVAEAAEREGVATRHLANPLQDIHELMWQPVYPRVEVVDHIDEPSARPTDPVDGRVSGL